jgi:hypothetical protein
MTTPNTKLKATGKSPRRRGARTGKARLTGKREVSPPVSVGGRKGTAEAAAKLELAVPTLIVLPEETGKIKLEVSTMTAPQMLTLLTKVSTDMAATPVYAALPVLTEVNEARTSLSTQVLNIENLEKLLREARLTLSQWEPACGAVLNRAAVACENADSNPATLVSGGWTLRSGRTPAQIMPPPDGLKLKQTAFAGNGVARWKAVPNARYYEVLVAPVEGAPLTLAEPVTLTSVQVKVALPPVAPGTMVTLCVRAIGVKGAGPYCDGLVARVN